MTGQPYGEVISPVFDEVSRNQRLVFLKFDEQDVELLHDLEGLFRERLDEIVEQFYKHMLAFEETRKVFRDEAMIRRLAEAQKAYLMEAVRGPYDAAYF